MKKKIKIGIILLVFIAMIFSACGLDWDGEITVTGGTKLPKNLVFNQDFPGIDGIDVKKFDPRGIDENIYRIRTYKSLADSLTVCNCIKPCEHYSKNPDENEKFLEKFNQEFFETKNVIIVSLAVSSITMNIRIDNISNNGVINITETKKLTFLPVNDVRVIAAFAIEIDSSFITPPSMSVVVKTK